MFLTDTGAPELSTLFARFTDVWSGISNWASGSDIFSHLPNPGIAGIIEMLIITVIFYYVAKSLKGTRAWVLFKGVAIILAVYALAYILKFDVIVVGFQNLLLFLGVAIIVIIQPELRKIIERIGSNNLTGSLKGILSAVYKIRGSSKQDNKRISDLTIQEIVKGSFTMSKAKTGALIVIECDIPLNEYVDSGIKLNSDITSQLFINIFEKNTPLHDGAVIIQHDKIAAATCYLPLSENKSINKDLGTRHRAGIGMSEATDAMVVIVSEETGAVSVAYGGKLHRNIDREKLAELLKSIQKTKESEINTKKVVNILEHNGAMKILAMAAAVFVWFVAMAAINPIETVTFRNVKIELLNTEILTNTGKTFEIIGEDTVTIKIKDRKSIVDTIELEDVQVIADFSKLSYVNAVPIEVLIHSAPGVEVSLNKSTLQIEMQDIVSTEVAIDINKLNSTADGYIIQDIKLNVDNLIITGSRSLVSTIERVVVDIDESKIKEDTVLRVVPKIYTSDGALVDNSKLQLNYEEIEVMITMYKTKTVGLRVDTPINNEILSSIIKKVDYDYATIVVTGPDEKLQALNDLVLTIPIEIPLKEIISKTSFIKNVTLQNYMPTGITVVEPSKLNINIEFVDYFTKEIVFNENNISLRGLQQGYDVTIHPQELKTVLISPSPDIVNATIDNLRPYIIVRGLDAGEHLIPIKYMTFGDNAMDIITVKITISESDYSDNTDKTSP